MPTPRGSADLEAAEPTLDNLTDALLLEADLTDASNPADLDGLSLYLREIGQTPLLTAAEEVALMTVIGAGKAAQARLSTSGAMRPPVRRRLVAARDAGETARTRMITANLRLVVSIAKKYQGRMELADLIQAGNLGLLRALKTFDIAKGYKFSTYATWWIWQAVSRTLAEQSRLVRLPVHRHDDARRLQRARSDLLGQFGREPTDAEVVAHLRIVAPKGCWNATRLRQVEQAIQIASVDSLDRPVGDDREDADPLGAFVAASCDTAAEAEASVLRETLARAVATLPERERRVIVLRYGLDTGEARTLDSVGKAFGVSRERIRQIEQAALRKLRHPSRSRAIASARDVA